MTPSSEVVLLAHGGGAPEAAMIGVPVLVLAAFAVLERRARRREAVRERQEAAEHPSADAADEA